MDEQRIHRWREQGIIDAAQAATLVEDIRKDPASARVPTWALFGATLVNGAVVYAYSALYGVDVVAHETMGLWVVCLLPLVYALRRSALTALFSLLAATWVLLFVYRGLGAIAIADRLVQLPVTLLLTGLGLFSLGGLHYVVPGMRPVARPMRMVGIQLALLSLFALTLDSVADGISLFNEMRDTGATTQVTVTLGALALLAVSATALGVVARPRAPDITRVEAPVTLSLVIAALLYLFAPLPGDALSILFTVVLFALGAALAYVGFARGDARVFRLGGITIGILVAVRVGDILANSASWVGVAAVALGIVAVSAVVVELVRKKTAKMTKTATATATKPSGGT